MFIYTHLVAIAQVADDDTGLTKLESDDARCSERVLTYTCVSSGKGATEVTLSHATIQGLEFSHSRYEMGSNVNLSSPDGDISAGNLSRSPTQQCLDRLQENTSYCYTTVIKVRLTERTRCMTIGCRTRFRTDVDRLEYFGNRTIARGK